MMLCTDDINAKVPGNRYGPGLGAGCQYVGLMAGYGPAEVDVADGLLQEARLFMALAV